MFGRGGFLPDDALRASGVKPARKKISHGSGPRTASVNRSSSLIHANGFGESGEDERLKTGRSAPEILGTGPFLPHPSSQPLLFAMLPDSTHGRDLAARDSLVKRIAGILKFGCLGLGGLALGLTAVGQVGAPVSPPSTEVELPPAVPKDDVVKGWTFEALPRAFQKNPLVDMTVITEMTPLGKKRPPTTPGHPAYYVATIGPPLEEGQTDGNTHPLSPDVVQAGMQHALATNGFFPADHDHRPSLVIFFAWGTYNRIPVNHVDPGNINVVARALLVGGEKFAGEFKHAIEQDQVMIEAGTPLGPNSNFRQFRRRDAKTEQLVNQARGEIYFIVASAFDYAAMSRNERQLLWRSRLTVDTRGVSMADTLPELMSSSAPFLGRQMSESALLMRRADRNGKVDIGDLKVMEPAEDNKPAPETEKGPGH